MKGSWIDDPAWFVRFELLSTGECLVSHMPPAPSRFRVGPDLNIMLFEKVLLNPFLRNNESIDLIKSIKNNNNEISLIDKVV